MRNHIISFSGGAASFATACEVIDKHGKDKVVLVFCDTTIEDEDLYRFIDEAAEKLDVPLIKLKDGRDPWQVFKDHKYQGNTRTAHCTVDLKGGMFAKWLKEFYPNPSNCVIYFGFDWSEEHRVKTAARNWAPYWVAAPLCKPPYLSRDQIFQYLDDYDIEIPRLYKMGFSHNNCGGFCVKAGQGHFANLLKQLPEVYEYHSAKQQQLMLDVPNVRPFLRLQVNSKLTYLTMAEFKQHLVDGGKYLKGDVAGCNCFSDTEANGIADLLKS